MDRNAKKKGLIFFACIAVLSFVGSFFLSRTAGFWLGAGLYIGLAVFRAIEQNIYVFAKRRKEAREEAEEENVDSD